MRDTAFRYVVRNKQTGMIYKGIYSLNQLEQIKLREVDAVLGGGYELIGRDQYSGFKDSNGFEVYENHIIEGKINGFVLTKAVVMFGEYEQDNSGGEYEPVKCIGFYAKAINPEKLNEFNYRSIMESEETTTLHQYEGIKIIGNVYDQAHLLEGEPE